MPKTPTARKSDPSTSHAAARSIARKAPTHRDLALKALRKAGRKGLTDFELADTVGVRQTSIGVRRGELASLGLVEKVTDRKGEVVTRPSPSGRASIAWRVIK
jgi:hypothetical protein